MAKEQIKGVRFRELLDKAHKSNRLKGIATELVHADYDTPFFVFSARVIMATDDPNHNQIFEGHGDAGAHNTSSMIVPHLLRMAESRAIARALRWATNTGEVAADELGGPSQASAPELIQQIRFHLQDPLITDEEETKMEQWLKDQPSVELLKGAVARLLRLIGERSQADDLDFTPTGTSIDDEE